MSSWKLIHHVSLIISAVTALPPASDPSSSPSTSAAQLFSAPSRPPPGFPLCPPLQTPKPIAHPTDGRRTRPRRRLRRHPITFDPVRDPEHGPCDAGAGLRHGLFPRAAGPGRHHPPRSPPRLPPPRHGLPLRHRAGRRRRRGRGRALGRRQLPRRPIRHLQARDLGRAPGPRRAGAAGIPRPPRPRLPRPLPHPLARLRPLRGASGVRHGGRVAGHGGVPPPGPGSLHRRQQLLRSQAGAAAVPRHRATGRQPGGAQRWVEAGEGAGGVRAARGRRLGLLAARRARRRLGFRCRHGERRPAPSRHRQRQDRRAGGTTVAVRAGRVLRGEELQQGEAGAEHGHLRLGADRRGEGDDCDNAAEEGVSGRVFRDTRRALQVSGRTLGR